MSFFPLLLELSGAPCLVAGGGALGAHKARLLLDSGADVTVVAPAVCPELAALPVKLIRRCVEAGDAEGMALVVDATGDAEARALLSAACRARHIPFNSACCAEDGIALTPYSALASGRLARRPGETSKRLAEDSYAKFKYDATADADALIIDRVAQIAESRGVTMTEVSLAWLLTKVTSPIVGATKPHHVDGAVAAAELTLSSEEVAFLEEPYVPHAIVGVMAQNKPSDANKEHVWLSNAKYLKDERR